MPRVGSGRRNAVKHKAQGNDNNVRSSHQLSMVSHPVNTAKPLQQSQSPKFRCSPSAANDPLVDEMSDLAIEMNPKVTKTMPNDKGLIATEVGRLNSSKSLSDPDSDDEIIMFSGRSARILPNLAPQTVLHLSTPKSGEDESKYASLPVVTSADSEVVSRKSSKTWNGERKLQEKDSKRSAARRRRALEDDEENAVIADYISNMQSNEGADVVSNQLQHRDLALDVEHAGSLHGSHVTNDVKENTSDERDWDNANLQDFDAFSTSSEPMNATPRILRRRFKKSEPQYLVVAAGGAANEARWLSRNLLTATTAPHLVDLFEEEQFEAKQPAGDRGFSDEHCTMETSDDEKDLREKSRICKSDEHIARLLSKQAQLGLVSDSLILFDGRGSEENLNKNVYAADSPVLIPKTLIPSGTFKKHSEARLPSVTRRGNGHALDAYDEIDVMDFEGSSMRKSDKRRQSKHPFFEHSDSDLQQSMNAAWQSDRAKKKQRKKERELLRTQGLLGKKKTHDLGKNFGGHVTIDDIIGEIKDFLDSSLASCSLPSMGKIERKLIHEIAHQSGLKSRSLGVGAARFPVLYRTSRTKTLTPALEAKIDTLFTPRNHRPRTNNVRGRGIQVTGNGSGAMKAAASYRDGEIVGVGAPEIGTGNKGRSMLEKMGWSTGTSLGALNNKGISEPIEQIVKTSKAGLG